MDPSALDPALSGAIDPSLGAAVNHSYDPSLASTSNIDPSLDPLLASLDPSTAAALQVALGEQSDEPVSVAPIESEEDKLHKLRTDFRAAAVSHWATLFLHHAGEEFNVEAFERDLINSDDDKFLPGFLGRVLNTLANDRNTNHTNWLNALRRSYNRRVTDRSDNPFYQWIRVPGSVVDAERAAEHEAEEKEWEEKYGTKYPGSTDGGHGPKAVWDDEEKKLREAEKGLSAQSTYAKNKAAAAAVKQENGEYVSEAGAAEVNMSGFSNEAKVPVTEEALDDGFNAEMADVIAADGVKEDNGEEDEEWYEEQRAVEWKDLSLETKLSAIYNVCEWHMVDPERQFRKYLQWDGESAWKIQRLDPLGLDKDGNKYYHLADDRLWIQRRAPGTGSEASPPLADGQYGQQAIKKPKTLLGLRAGPRDKSKKGTVTGTIRVKLKKDKATGKFTQVADDEQDVQVGEGDEDDEEKIVVPEREIEEVEMPVWEKEYWEERARAENTPGFVEWEALCLDLNDWRAFPQRFNYSTDPNEIKLREKITLETIPGIEEDLARRETERLEAEAAEVRRSANAESAAEAENRQAAERLHASERISRSTRHARPQSYAEDQFGVAAATGRSSASTSAGAALGGSPALEQGESREERLRKREEEKRRAEEVEAARAAQEAWENEREQARMANGGQLPAHLMTPEEREAFEKQQERERKKREAEEKKKTQEEKKQKARAKERRAELKAERDAIEAEERAAEEAAAAAAAARAAASQYAAMLPDPNGAVDDPWWMDCELCGLAGWNVDDGQELICCDECEEWQHLPCHQRNDMANGLPPQPFHDEDYQWKCGRCQGLVVRTQRPPLPNPPNAALQVPSAAQSGKRRASDANGRGGKSQGSKKPKSNKQPVAAPNPAIPYGHGAHPLYHPSAYTATPSHSHSHSPAPPVQSQPEPQAAQADPQAPMSYDQLKEMVQTNPALLGQLPPDYQVHFSQLLGIPLP